MSDHLPECKCNAAKCPPDCYRCVCDVIRGCEARVRDGLVVSVLDGSAVLAGRRLVFLSDVRDAIDRLPRNADTRDALAAIDALRGNDA